MSEKNKLIPGLPSGFEDRWNKTLILKKRLLKVIENNFIKYGFDPLETPSFEISENIAGIELGGFLGYGMPSRCFPCVTTRVIGKFLCVCLCLGLCLCLGVGLSLCMVCVYVSV